MTTLDRSERPPRFEQELRGALQADAGTARPDYLYDTLLRTVEARQRPAWTFAGRWLPMVDFARQPVLAPRLPWRSIALAVALIALLLAGAWALISGGQRRLPAPYGPAGNGLVAYDVDGDIFTADPVTGVATAIVSGPSWDYAPRFSRDGTRIAFLREVAGGTLLVIVDADGRNEFVATSDPLTADVDIDGVNWSPDGRSIALSTHLSLLQVDTAGRGLRRLAVQFEALETYWRPPDGRQLLFLGRTERGLFGLFLVIPDTGDVELLRDHNSWLRPLGWTPDGRRLAYRLDDGSDGMATRVLDLATGAETKLPVDYGRISRDGTRVFGNVLAGLCVISIDGGPCRLVGDRSVIPAGMASEANYWSPDDAWILVSPDDGTPAVLVDPDTGRVRQAPWRRAGPASWQRRAP